MDQPLRYRRSSYVGSSPYAPDNDISLRELIEILWGGKWLIIICSLVLAVAAGAASLAMPKTYRAAVVVAPVLGQPNNTDTGSALLSQLASVSALAGLRLAAADGRSEAIAILDSSGLSAAYIRRHNLLPVLYPDRWDRQAGKWRTQDRAKIPTLWQANTFFTRHVKRVTEDGRTGMITLTITWTDPVLAARWANELVAATNEYLRGKAIREAESNIAYLHQQAARTSLVQVQNALYSLLETQIKTAMLARGTSEYALRVIDAAVPPEKPTSPDTLLWAVAGLCAGLFSSAFFVFARTAWRAPP